MDWKPVNQQGNGSPLGMPGKKKMTTGKLLALYVALMLALCLFCFVMSRCSPEESGSSSDSSQSSQTEQVEEDNSGDGDSSDGDSDSDSSDSDENASKSGSGASGESSQDDPSDSDEDQAKETVLTKKNSMALAALLKVKDPFSSKVSDFAEKHEGDTIEFDGYVADLQCVEGMKTRFNVLIYAAGSPVKGPYFHYDDVNFYEMHVKPDSVDILTANTKVRVTAKVVSYSEVTGFFELDPIETYVKK